jgi:hypothetical protein
MRRNRSRLCLAPVLSDQLGHLSALILGSRAGQEAFKPGRPPGLPGFDFKFKGLSRRSGGGREKDQNAGGDFLPALADFAYRADTRRAAGFTTARGQ